MGRKVSAESWTDFGAVDEKGPTGPMTLQDLSMEEKQLAGLLMHREERKVSAFERRGLG